MLQLVVRVEDLEKKTSVQHVFSESPVHIGRNNLCDVSLIYPFVSLWHGMLRFDERSVEYVDLNSTNGSNVDGRRAKKNIFFPVSEKTDLRIGTLRLHIARRSGSVASEPARQTQFRMRTLIAHPSPEPAPVAQRVQPTARRAALETTGDDRFGRISDELYPFYVRYRQEWRSLMDRLVDKLAAVPKDEKARVLETLLERMPSLQQEEQFRSLPLREQTVIQEAPLPGEPSRSRIAAERPLTTGTSNEVGAVALSLLRVFAQTYGSEEDSLRSPAEVERLLNQMAAVLETFSKAFVELRRGVDQFVEEMAVRATTTLSPLRTAQTATDVLRFLLDAKSESESEQRLKSLRSGFAHVMIHQVALLSGFKEGIRALLGKLSPEVFEGHYSADGTAKKFSMQSRFGIIGRKVWPFRVFGQWRQYRRRYAEFAEEERLLQSVVFGPEFAHAYLLMVSGHPPAP